jgi:hypothetical protein
MVGMVMCIGGLLGGVVIQSLRLESAQERAVAAERKAEKLDIGQTFLAEVVKYVQENCADKLSTCKQEAVMELPCYPNCAREEP